MATIAEVAEDTFRINLEIPGTDRRQLLRRMRGGHLPVPGAPGRRLGQDPGGAPATLACHHGGVKGGQITPYLRALREHDVTGVTQWNPMREPRG